MEASVFLICFIINQKINRFSFDGCGVLQIVGLLWDRKQNKYLNCVIQIAYCLKTWTGFHWASFVREIDLILVT